MKIIITDSFKLKYKKVLSLIDIKKLSDKIKLYNLITLKYPYLKLKLIIGGISIRGVLLKTKGGNLVYLILCLKKDKNCGYNITFNSLKKEIYLMEEKVLNDLKSKSYEEFIY